MAMAMAVATAMALAMAVAMAIAMAKAILAKFILTFLPYLVDKIKSCVRITPGQFVANGHSQVSRKICTDMF